LGNFRLLYKKEKFLWGAKSPGYVQELQFMVRSTKNKKIMAFIIGIPKKIVVFGKTMKMVEVNFLAVHRKLRAKRMA